MLTHCTNRDLVRTAGGNPCKRVVDGLAVARFGGLFSLKTITFHVWLCDYIFYYPAAYTIDCAEDVQERCKVLYAPCCTSPPEILFSSPCNFAVSIMITGDLQQKSDKCVLTAHGTGQTHSY